jgi:hypothetical protein
MEVGHGQEASEEGKKVSEEEEEESGRPKDGKVGQEDRQEGGGQEEDDAEGRRKEARSQGDADGGAGSPRDDRDCRPGALHGGDAGGEDRAEPRRGLAFPDGFEALSGLRMNCGQSGASGLPG